MQDFDNRLALNFVENYYCIIQLYVTCAVKNQMEKTRKGHIGFFFQRFLWKLEFLSDLHVHLAFTGARVDCMPSA